MPLLTTAFRLGARLRGARAFHPHGVVLDAVWRPSDAGREILVGAPLLERDRPALVRFSHGIGLPAGAPDLLGVALKVPDVHGDGRDQDLLFTSTGRGRIGRRLLRPSRMLSGGVFSTLLPYDIAGAGRHPLVAVASATPTVSYHEVSEGAAPPRFEVRVGGAGETLLGTVDVEGNARPGDDGTLAFDPWHTGPNLRPAGWINRLRRPTYGASRAGRADRRRER
ncbi:hypothetical protein [Egicoccus sp. AB-alg6-2]|uniref:hypothetical protein n=1 Tax=Egicoccus sp. AB-alg6-2 TaxID=3242692 RepID=UPI00359DF706